MLAAAHLGSAAQCDRARRLCPTAEAAPGGAEVDDGSATSQRENGGRDAERHLLIIVDGRVVGDRAGMPGREQRGEIAHEYLISSRAWALIFLLLIVKVAAAR